MAKCFDVVGYVEPCNAVRQKYTGRALLIVAGGGGVQLEFSTNGLFLDKINQKASFLELYNSIQEVQTVKIYPVSIEAENPFGVTVQGNTDSGRVMYTKTVSVSMPATAESTAEIFIMGLQKGIKGEQAILVTERIADGTEPGKCGDAFGTYSHIRIDPASVTRNEYENGGAWQFNLVCEEPVPNVICAMTDLTATLDAILNA